jgi:hypothetical protein
MWEPTDAYDEGLDAYARGADVEAAFEVSAQAIPLGMASGTGSSLRPTLTYSMFMHGISNAIGERDLIAAQKKIMGEVSQVSQDMTQFIMGSDRGILEKTRIPTTSATPP